jgi:multiple sugar transport system substrate-binding protein
MISNDSPRLSRRAALGLSATAAAGALTGCGSDGAGSGSATEGRLRVGWYGGDPVHAAMRKALDAYHGKHPGVTVNTEFAPFDAYWDKLATQTAARDAPDVYRMSMSYFAEYAERTALLDLSDAVGSTIKTDGLDADVAASGEIADGVFGVGQSSISHAVFANPAAWSKVGAEPPATDWTWESFAELAMSYAAETGKGEYGTTDSGGNVQILEPYLRQLGSSLFTADGSGLAVRAGEVQQWLSYWHDLRTAGAAPPPAVSAEATEFATSLLAKGKAPLTFGWVQQITFYQPVMHDPLEIYPLPAPEAGSLTGQFLKALDFWVVSATTKNSEGAFALIDYLINDPDATKTIGLTLGVPPSETSRQQLDSGPDSAEGKAIAYVDRIKDEVGPPPGPWPEGYSTIQDSLSRVNEDVGFGRIDPAAGAARFIEEAQAAFG